MIFLKKKKAFNNMDSKQHNLVYSIKSIQDFLFFTHIIKEYIKLHIMPSLHLLRNLIYLLNILAVKYILFTKYSGIFYMLNNSLIKVYTLELLSWRNKILLNTKALQNIEQKILLIKKISRTREKGRTRRYKVIILVGNRSGWFGIGYSKNYYLQDAISSARLHAFKNIYHIPVFFSNLLKNNIQIERKFKKIYLFSSNSKIKSPAHYTLRVLFDFAGITNISSKVIRIHNIYNILALILKI